MASREADILLTVAKSNSFFELGLSVCLIVENSAMLDQSIAPNKQPIYSRFH